MGERDVVWEHGENLFPGFKCKYCVKEFRSGRATRLMAKCRLVCIFFNFISLQAMY
jgi:hypothetical protein